MGYLSVGDVDGQVDISERPRPDLPDQLVFSPDYKLGFGAAATRHNPHQLLRQFRLESV